MDTEGEPIARRTFLAISVLIVLAGLALAIARLGEASLWLDESYSWWFTRLEWGDLLRAARIDAVNPPLYYLFAKAISPATFAPAAGGARDEAALRFPSVVAQAAGIAAAIYLGSRVGGRTGGLAAGILWAAHPMALWAARDARPYALAAALAAGVVGAFFYLRRSPSTVVTIVAGLGLALGLLTHYFFFVLAAALVLLSALDIRSSPAFFRRWTLLTLLALLPLAAWLVWFFSMGTTSLGIGWIREPRLNDIPLTLWNLASGYAGVMDVWTALFGVAVVGIAAAGLGGASRSDWLKIAMAGLGLPLLAVWILSQRRPVYVDRYFVVLLPFIGALVALGADRIARRTAERPPGPRRAVRAGIAIGFALAALAVGLNVQSAPKFQKEDWRGLAAFLRKNQAAAGSLSLSEPEIALPLSFYFDEDVLRAGPRLIPACEASCWWVMRQPYTATHALTQSVAEEGRASVPDVPPWCRQLDIWDSPTGVAVWKIDCVRDVTDE